MDTNLPGQTAEPLVHFLRARGVHMVQVSPMHTKRIKELQGNSPNKTDEKDPKVIADIIELGHALKVVIPEGPAAELRILVPIKQGQGSVELSNHQCWARCRPRGHERD